MGESWRANFQAIRLVGAITYEVYTELTLGMFDGRIGFAFGYVEAFGE